MRNRVSVIGSALLFAVLAAGCAKAPQDDVNAAQAELDKAREAQSDVWAPNEYQAADQAMSAAKAEIEAQDQKWLKNFDKAKELLATAKEEAAKAATAASANKEQARKDSEAALAEADTVLQAAEAALKAAPVTKDSKADLALYRSDLDGLRQTLDGARQAFDAGDYKKTLESTTSVKDKANTIASDLEAARQKRAGVRR
jgi:hypothetical protein